MTQTAAPQTAAARTAAPDPVQHVFQLATGYIVSTALHAAVEVGVADRLAGGPLTVREIAEATGTNEDALYRVLRLLASLGVFAEVAPRRFALTPPAEVLRADAPNSIKPVVHFVADPFHLRVYADAMHSVRTGLPAGDKTVGMPVFEYLVKNPRYSEIFNDAMTNMSAVIIPAALEAYNFGDIGLLVDVAGGHGHVLTSILKKYPKMRGILMDLDHVVAGAQPRVTIAGVSDRCEVVAGDFFKAVPPGGDAYIMKHIIHDWDDDRAAAILRNIHAAMGPGRGRVILLESVVPPGNEPSLAKVMDLEMMLLPGGRERTEAEFRALFDRAGFDLTRIVPTKSPICVIEARKR
jgi:O-methyltransferase domain/Dimerisation domain